MLTALATPSRLNVNFHPYSGELNGLCVDENHLVFRWDKPGSDILFSVARRGDACSIHYSHSRSDKKRIEQAVTEFIDFVYWLFPWCKMILGYIHESRKGVEALAIKLGFTLIAKGTGSESCYKIYMRPKDD